MVIYIRGGGVSLESPRLATTRLEYRTVVYIRRRGVRPESPCPPTNPLES